VRSVVLPALAAAAVLSLVGPAAAQSPEESAGVAAGFVEVDDGKVFYEASGEGPAVVLIHDGLLHRVTWDAQVSALARNHRVIRWDRRGYGRSPCSEVPFRNLDDLHALLVALGIERASLVGCSSGSLAAMEFALEYPEMVRSLVLVGPIVSGFGFTEHFTTRGGRGLPDRDAPVEAKITYWTEVDPWVMAPESTAARQTMARLLSQNPQNLSRCEAAARWPGFSCLDRLPEIGVPTLIVVGEADIPDVHAHAGVIDNAIPDSRRVILNHSGHLAHLEVPDEFNALVLPFLDSAE
jgi:pimeloyl-ACP methyl ester carboxylesterase